MTLISIGPVYIGYSELFYADAYLQHGIRVHLGHLVVEFDSDLQLFRGSTEAPDHESKDAQAA